MSKKIDNLTKLVAQTQTSDNFNILKKQNNNIINILNQLLKQSVKKTVYCWAT